MNKTDALTEWKTVAYEVLKATHDPNSPAHVLSPFALQTILRLLLPHRSEWPPTLGPSPNRTHARDPSHLVLRPDSPTVQCSLGPALVLTPECLGSGSLVWSVRMTGSEVWCIGVIDAEQPLLGNSQWYSSPCGYVSSGAGPVQKHLSGMHGRELVAMLDMDARLFHLYVAGVECTQPVPRNIKVFKARREVLGMDVCVKLLNVGAHKGKSAKYPPQEVGISMRLSHPNIIRVFSVLPSLDAAEVIVMELCSGSLRRLSSSLTRSLPVPLREHWIRDWSRQIARGLCYLRNAGVIHRDIKIDNVLYRVLPDGSYQLKIADFGLSSPQPLAESILGTQGYTAPEVLRGVPYDFKVDMWSLGAVVYLLMTDAHAPTPTDFNALPERYSLPPECPCSAECDSFVSALMTVYAGASFVAKPLTSDCRSDPEKRLGHEDALAHPFLKSSFTVYCVLNGVTRIEIPSRSEDRDVVSLADIQRAVATEAGIPEPEQMLSLVIPVEKADNVCPFTKDLVVSRKDIVSAQKVFPFDNFLPKELEESCTSRTEELAALCRVVQANCKVIHDAMLKTRPAEQDLLDTMTAALHVHAQADVLASDISSDHLERCAANIEMWRMLLPRVVERLPTATRDGSSGGGLTSRLVGAVINGFPLCAPGSALESAPWCLSKTPVKPDYPSLALPTPILAVLEKSARLLSRPEQCSNVDRSLSELRQCMDTVRVHIQRLNSRSLKIAKAQGSWWSYLLEGLQRMQQLLQYDSALQAAIAEQKRVLDDSRSLIEQIQVL
eukprot:m51a1_g10543 putative testis-specific serine threonine-protein kinase 3 (779) ;mRNA; f:19444-22732